jgi:zinc protease
LKAVRKEFEMIASKGPDKSYLDKVKKQWLEEHKTSIKENNFWLNQLVEYKTQGGNPDRLINYEKYVNALTPKDVQQAAKIILQGKNQFFAVLMPETVLKGGETEKKKGF